MGQPLFSLLRPAYENTPELADLASQVRADRESNGNLERQIDFDNGIARELSSLRLTGPLIKEIEGLLSLSGLDLGSPLFDVTKPQNPDGQLSPSRAVAQAEGAEQEEEEEDKEAAPRRARPRTILLAVGVGLIATVCMAIFLISDRLNTFDGADRISELLDAANSLTGDEFEAVETKAGDLQDWFFLKHGLEHYAVPKQFASMKTVGCRVFKFNGATVAQIMAIADKEVLFYMFPSDDLGIKVRDGKWEIVEDDNWVGGVTGVNETCFLVAFKGNKNDMKAFLAKAGR
ncbi:MAG: hypothetical protein JOZ21_07045 [Verrucomicrobia bacterium]|nr:hypothetical protein [Verrucomicrobiota bacterium]